MWTHSIGTPVKSVAHQFSTTPTFPFSVGVCCESALLLLSQLYSSYSTWVSYVTNVYLAVFIINLWENMSILKKSIQISGILLSVVPYFYESKITNFTYNCVPLKFWSREIYIPRVLFCTNFNIEDNILCSILYEPSEKWRRKTKITKLQKWRACECHVPNFIFIRSIFISRVEIMKRFYNTWRMRIHYKRTIP